MTQFQEVDLVALLLTQFWQVTLLIAVVWIATKLLAKDRPHLAHALWVLVLIKCITPPIWCSPTSPFSWISGKQSVARPVGDIESDRALGSATQRNQDPNRLIYHARPMSQSNPDKSSLKKIGEAPANFVFGWRPFLQYIWILGVAIGISVAVLRFVAFSVWMKQREVATPARFQQHLDHLAKRLGLKRHVRLLVLDGHVGPAVLGLFRPRILMPAAILRNKTEKDIESLLAHELIHVRRGDLVWAMIQTLATNLFWFHPFVWIASNRVTLESERSCDEETVANLGCSPSAYARGLIDVLEQKNVLKERLRVAPALPGVRPVDITSARLERVMKLGNGSLKRTPLWIWFVMLICGALVLPGAALVWGQDSEPNNDSTESIVLPKLPESDRKLTQETFIVDSSSQLVARQKGVPFLSNIPYINRLFKNAGIGHHWELNWIDASELLAEMRKQDYQGQTAEQKLLSLLNCRDINWHHFTVDKEATYRLSNGELVKFGNGEPTTKIIGDAVFVFGTKDHIDKVAKRLARIQKLGGQQVAVDVKFMTIDRAGFDSLKVEWQVAKTTSGKSVADIQLADARFQDNSADAKIRSTFIPDQPVSAATFVGKTIISRYAVVDDTQVAAILDDAQKNKRANIMMSPRVLVIDGQHASIKDVEDVPFVVGYEQVDEETHQPEVRIIEEGLTINLNPIIKTGTDSNFIQLNCQLENRNIKSVENARFATAKDKNLALDIQIPEVETTRITSSLEVQLGKTILLSSPMNGDNGEKESLLVFLSCQIPEVQAGDCLLREVEKDTADDAAPKSKLDDNDSSSNDASIMLNGRDGMIKIFGSDRVECEFSDGATVHMENGKAEASADSIIFESVNGQRTLRLNGEAKFRCAEDLGSQDAMRVYAAPGLMLALPADYAADEDEKIYSFFLGVIR